MDSLWKFQSVHYWKLTSIKCEKNINLAEVKAQLAECRVHAANGGIHLECKLLVSSNFMGNKTFIEEFGRLITWCYQHMSSACSLNIHSHCWLTPLLIIDSTVLVYCKLTDLTQTVPSPAFCY